MAKLKIVHRSVKDAAKPAASGSTRTGAKVEKVKAGKKGANQSEGRFVGVTSGLGVTKYQNQTILGNMKKKLTDEELARDWRREFPNARAEYDAGTVRSVRGLVNKGKHGNDAPARPIPEFDDSGDPLPFRGEKAAAAREAKEARASEKAPAKGKTVKIVKKLKK